MAASNPGRKALRGKEEQALDAISEALEPEEWAEWLRAPLERAAAKGERGLARMLVGAGADYGNAPREAVRGGHTELVNDLLDNGAAVSSKDKSGCTLLHFAAAEGDAEMVRLLMLRGADKDARDSKRYTPLYRAVMQRNHATVIALLAGGADVNLRIGPTDTTLVCTVIREGGRVEILRSLIEHGADVDAGDIDNDTALHVAAEHDEVEAIAVLVEAGADIEARGRMRCTPLHAATKRLNLRVLAALLEHGANVNAQNSMHQTPLHYAALRCATPGGGEATDLLLRSGADETLVDDEHAAKPAAFPRALLRTGCLVAKRVLDLLNNAPADRAWRRRGYLVLCRAHPDRIQQRQDLNGTARGGAAQKTLSGAKLARREESSVDEKETGGCSTVKERNDADWAGVVARVLRLKEEGIFRTIVGYL